jgi:peptide/nickel transport system substrate-binding protein
VDNNPWNFPIALPDPLQEKPRHLYEWGDFQKDGEKAYDNGNYAEAVRNFEKAEEMLIAVDPARSSFTDNYLATIETRKGMAFSDWDGHETESMKAFDKANELKESSEAKAKTERGGSGCLIVTATFGSPLAAEVQLVRSFRDDSIARSYTGSRFMPGFNAWYYSFSPQVSAYINDHPVVRPALRVLITPILQIVLFAQSCYTFLSFNPELATIVAIIVGSTLYGLIYVFPAVMAGVWVARRRGWAGADIRSTWPAAAAWSALLLLIIAGAALSLDLLTTVASGLFVIATILLVVSALSLSLSRYVARTDRRVQE